jgi:hypothetical protein
MAGVDLGRGFSEAEFPGKGRGEKHGAVKAGCQHGRSLTGAATVNLMVDAPMGKREAPFDDHGRLYTL